MLFSMMRRDARAVEFALASTAAVAVLTRLRQQAIPLLADIPAFVPRARAVASAPTWLSELPRQVARQALLAGALAAVVLLVAVTLPSWLPLPGGTGASSALRSSTGVTGSAATRVEDLGVSTFVGRIPFVQQLRYYDSLTLSRTDVARFVAGARQASVVEYLNDVGAQVALPYLNDAVQTRQAIDTWTQAAQEAERQAAIEAATSRPVWQAPPIVAGTRLGATVTFYACIGNGFCDIMASGAPPFDGAAACSSDLSFGTKFVVENDPLRRVFVCLDRGALAPTWVDIWFYDAADGWAWQSIVGTSSDITIVE